MILNKKVKEWVNGNYIFKWCVKWFLCRNMFLLRALVHSKLEFFSIVLVPQPRNNTLLSISGGHIDFQSSFVLFDVLLIQILQPNLQTSAQKMRMTLVVCCPLSWGERQQESPWRMTSDTRASRHLERGYNSIQVCTVSNNHLLLFLHPFLLLLLLSLVFIFLFYFLCFRPVGCRRHYVFGLSVHPAVRPSIRPYGNLVNTKSQEPLGGFLSYLAQGCTMTSRWTD